MGFLAILSSEWNGLPLGKKKHVCTLPEGVLLLNPGQCDSPEHIPPMWKLGGENYVVFCNPGITELDSERISKFLDKEQEEAVLASLELSVDEEALTEFSEDLVLSIDLEALDALPLPKPPLPPIVLFYNEVPLVEASKETP